MHSVCLMPLSVIHFTSLSLFASGFLSDASFSVSQSELCASFNKKTMKLMDNT